MSAQVLPFVEVHDHLREFVLRTLAAAGVGAAEVDDVAQEVFVLLHRKAVSFADLRSARSWLYEASRKLARNHHRGRQRSLARRPAWSPAAAPDLEAQIEARRSLGRVAEATEALEPAACSAFTQVELRGLSAAEAAATLGLNVNTTRSHVQRVRTRLRRALMLLVIVAAGLSTLLAGTCSSEPTVAEVSDDASAHPVRRGSNAEPRPAAGRRDHAGDLRVARRDGHRGGQPSRDPIRTPARARSA